MLATRHVSILLLLAAASALPSLATAQAVTQNGVAVNPGTYTGHTGDVIRVTNNTGAQITVKVNGNNVILENGDYAEYILGGGGTFTIVGVGGNQWIFE